MAKIHVSFKGYHITSMELLIPDESAGKARVIWLLHDFGGRGDDFLRYTKLENYCKKNSWYAVCVNIGRNEYYDRPDEDHANWESFVTQYLWNLVHQILPSMPEQPEYHFIAGAGSGGEAAKRFQLTYSQKYGSYALLSKENPQDWEEIDLELKQIIRMDQDDTYIR